jgi:hypothetical protein
MKRWTTIAQLRIAEPNRVRHAHTCLLNTQIAVEVMQPLQATAPDERKKRKDLERLQLLLKQRLRKPLLILQILQ